MPLDSWCASTPARSTPSSRGERAESALALIDEPMHSTSLPGAGRFASTSSGNGIFGIAVSAGRIARAGNPLKADKFVWLRGFFEIHRNLLLCARIKRICNL